MNRHPGLHHIALSEFSVFAIRNTTEGKRTFAHLFETEELRKEREILDALWLCQWQAHGKKIGRECAGSVETGVVAVLLSFWSTNCRSFRRPFPPNFLTLLASPLRKPSSLPPARLHPPLALTTSFPLTADDASNNYWRGALPLFSSSTSLLRQSLVSPYQLTAIVTLVAFCILPSTSRDMTALVHDVVFQYLTS